MKDIEIRDGASGGESAERPHVTDGQRNARTTARGIHCQQRNEPGFPIFAWNRNFAPDGAFQRIGRGAEQRVLEIFRRPFQDSPHETVYAAWNESEWIAGVKYGNPH